ncbi:MAG: hypothetical protein Q4C96_07365 [Planctomycetia bacterium]|nr:hypothetical protein [Planctomycetia bacterium]
MFEKTKTFFQWLFGTTPKVEKPRTSLVARQLSRGETLAEGERVCVMDGARLINVLDRLPTADFAETTVFWSIPKEDVSVSLQFPCQAKGQTVATTVQIRFEPEMGLGTFLESRRELSETDWKDWLQSMLSGLLDVLRTEPEALISLSGAALETFRAKFSVLLSSHGFRCTGIAPFETHTVQEPPVSTDEVDKELCETVQKIQKPEEWQRFTQTLKNEGLPASDETEEKLEEVGALLLRHEMTSQECVRAIRQMAEDAAGQRELDTSYWNGLAIRLRLENEEAQPRREEITEETFPVVTVGKSQRPKKAWFFSNNVRLDGRLRTFLAEKIVVIQDELTTARRQTEDIRVQTEFRLLERELETIHDLLSMMPEWTARKKDLRVAEERIPMLLKNMNQAITAAEYVEAALKKQEGLELPAFRAELKNSLAILRNQLENRYHIR